MWSSMGSVVERPQTPTRRGLEVTIGGVITLVFRLGQGTHTVSPIEDLPLSQTRTERETFLRTTH